MDWIQIEGASMRPFLRPGEEIGVKWLRQDEEEVPGPGEIVLARDAVGRWVVHRVLRSSVSQYVLKGDSALALDRVTRAEVWGKVVALRKRGTEAPGYVNFEPATLDRWIAALSGWSLGLFFPARALIRRLALGLAAWRRWRL